MDDRIDDGEDDDDDGGVCVIVSNLWTLYARCCCRTDDGVGGLGEPERVDHLGHVYRLCFGKQIASHWSVHPQLLTDRRIRPCQTNERRGPDTSVCIVLYIEAHTHTYRYVRKT